MCPSPAVSSYFHDLRSLCSWRRIGFTTRKTTSSYHVEVQLLFLALVYTICMASRKVFIRSTSRVSCPGGTQLHAIDLAFEHRLSDVCEAETNSLKSGAIHTNGDFECCFHPIYVAQGRCVERFQRQLFRSQSTIREMLHLLVFPTDAFDIYIVHVSKI